MQIANCLVSLGGDHGNTVSKFHVTAAEIAVLRAIHGEDAVNDIEPIGDVKRSNREERARIGAIYGQAKTPDGKASIVESMFPGVAARVFETIAELELDESFFKATGRLTAAPAVRPSIDPNSGPTIAEWVAAGYKASAYPPSGYASKSTPEEIAAAVAAETPPAHEPPQAEAEAEGDAEEGVGEDINDEHAEKPEGENILG
ncbi:MAG: hypothetical protein ACXWLZ_00010 [Rhizomicrobium sp.]